MWYNGRELTESEILALMCEETDAETGTLLVVGVLLPFDGISEQTENSIFWTEKGSVFHKTAACRYLSNKTVYYGTVEDAVSQNKLRACTACQKES